MTCAKEIPEILNFIHLSNKIQFYPIIQAKIEFYPIIPGQNWILSFYRKKRCGSTRQAITSENTNIFGEVYENFLLQEGVSENVPNFSQFWPCPTPIINVKFLTHE